MSKEVSQIFYCVIEQNHPYISDKNVRTEISDQRKKNPDSQPNQNLTVKNEKLFCAGINFLFSIPKCLKIFFGKFLMSKEVSQIFYCVIEQDNQYILDKKRQNRNF